MATDINSLRKQVLQQQMQIAELKAEVLRYQHQELAAQLASLQHEELTQNPTQES